MLDLQILFSNGGHAAKKTSDTGWIDRLAWGLWFVFSNHGIMCTPVQIMQRWGQYLDEIEETSRFTVVCRQLCERLRVDILKLESDRDFSPVSVGEALSIQFNSLKHAKRLRSECEREISHIEKRIAGAGKKLSKLKLCVEDITSIHPFSQVVNLFRRLENKVDVNSQSLQVLIERIDQCDTYLSENKDLAVKLDREIVMNYFVDDIKKPTRKAMRLLATTSLFESWGTITCDEKIIYTNGSFLLFEKPQYDLPPFILSSSRFSGQDLTEAVNNMVANHGDRVHPISVIDLRNVDVEHDKLDQFTRDCLVVFQVNGKLLSFRRGYIDYLVWRFKDVEFYLGSGDSDDDYLYPNLIAKHKGFVVGVVCPLQLSDFNDYLNGIYETEDFIRLAA